MSEPKERVGFQLLKQHAAKAVGLTFPREDFKCFWEALGYRGVEQVEVRQLVSDILLQVMGRRKQGAEVGKR